MRYTDRQSAYCWVYQIQRTQKNYMYEPSDRQLTLHQRIIHIRPGYLRAGTVNHLRIMLWSLLGMFVNLQIYAAIRCDRSITCECTLRSGVIVQSPAIPNTCNLYDRTGSGVPEFSTWSYTVQEMCLLIVWCTEYSDWRRQSNRPVTGWM